jgi:hypothetical protein
MPVNNVVPKPDNVMFFQHGDKETQANTVQDNNLINENILKNENWDEGGLFGCCSGGRSCLSGTYNLCTACCCFTDKFKKFTGAIQKFTNNVVMTQNLERINKAIETDDTTDDKQLFILYVDIMQHEFSQKYDYVVCAFNVCQPCFVDYVMRTVDKLQAKYKLILENKNREAAEARRKASSGEVASRIRSSMSALTWR